MDRSISQGIDEERNEKAEGKQREGRGKKAKGSRKARRQAPLGQVNPLPSLFFPLDPPPQPRSARCRQVPSRRGAEAAQPVGERASGRASPCAGCRRDTGARLPWSAVQSVRGRAEARFAPTGRQVYPPPEKRCRRPPKGRQLKPAFGKEPACPRQPRPGLGRAARSTQPSAKEPVCPRQPRPGLGRDARSIQARQSEAVCPRQPRPGRQVYLGTPKPSLSAHGSLDPADRSP